MAAKSYLETHTSTDESALQKLEKALNTTATVEKKAEEEYFDLRKNNLEELAKYKVELINKEKVKELSIEQKAKKRLIELEVKNDKKKQEYIAKAKAKAAKNGKLTKDLEKSIEAEAKAKFEIEQKTRDKLEKKYKKQEERKAVIEEQQEANKALSGTLFSKGATISERGKALKNAFTSSDGGFSFGKGMSALTSALADLATQLNGTIEEIAGAKTAIDTRLQGSRSATKSGSYWDKISSDISTNIGASPLVKQADVVSNLKTMVGKGISFNVEQRAFLETIKDKIATTFEATDGTLLKLVRIQQEDTTAARLGMESALTSFLNNMYETTEYMSEMATSIRQNIYEASALMTAKSATEFEYQIQKWMGSLYSVGFSNTSGLSQALGNLAAGNISSISDGGFGNLLVMAANKANLSVADILADGLDSSETNQLMQAMVNYLGQIYSETKGSNILAQQYAGVFGLTASDLKAAANLARSTSNIANNNLSYSGMNAQLTNMANTMYQRVSMGQKMSNAWSNFQYSTAAGIANNPAVYAIYKIAGLLDNVAGGINLPIVTPFASLNTSFNVADIMQAGALGYSLLSGMGSMLGGLTDISGNRMLKGFNIGSSNVVTRGTGSGLLTTSGATTSESAYSANSSSSDIKNKMMTDTQDDTNQQITAAESEGVSMETVDGHIVNIYELLDQVTKGELKLHVDIDDTAVWSTDNTGKINIVF